MQAQAAAVGSYLDLLPFRQIWCLDFEYRAPDGERPLPHCLCAKELRSGKELQFWGKDLTSLQQSPFDVGPGSLFLAWYASAEWNCFKVLGWPMPASTIDLFAEFRNHTNGLRPKEGAGLLGGLLYFGLDAMGAREKESMRALAIRGDPFTEDERIELLDYCRGDVLALERILPSLLPHIDVPRALFRGHYMVCAAEIEHAGIPIDLPLLARLRERWGHIKARLVAEVDTAYAVYEGTTFKIRKFEKYLDDRGLPWPRLESGELSLKEETFDDMAKAYPEITPLKEVRLLLSKMRIEKLAVGQDARNRRMLSAFGSSTGRNQPSNSKFIFGYSAWIRGLIKPPPGRALIYCDWSAQEFGIAAALSTDEAMMRDYQCDPYLSFGKRLGSIPHEGTKATHRETRDQLKISMLGILYGMGEELLALTARISSDEARHQLVTHHRSYPTYWAWSDAAVYHAMLHGWLRTVYGWELHLGEEEARPTSIRNFLIQANAAEMMRVAIVLAAKEGITVVAPVHDALLCECNLADVERTTAAIKAVMVDASLIVLRRMALRSDATVIAYPDRYADDRGREMWPRMMKMLEEP